jgi:hypothetical protein
MLIDSEVSRTIELFFEYMPATPGTGRRASFGKPSAVFKVIHAFLDRLYPVSLSAPKITRALMYFGKGCRAKL